jgi:hypothetical protein
MTAVFKLIFPLIVGIKWGGVFTSPVLQTLNGVQNDHAI